MTPDERRRVVVTLAGQSEAPPSRDPMDMSFLQPLYDKIGAERPGQEIYPGARYDLQQAPGSSTQADILKKAREVALTSVEAEDKLLAPVEVFKFMKAMGFPKPPEWCASFVAAVAKGAGHPAQFENPGGSRNWLQWGREVYPPRPGDIAIAHTGGQHHAVIVDRTGSWGDPDAAIKGGRLPQPAFWGIGQSTHHGTLAGYPLKDFEYRRMDDPNMVITGPLPKPVRPALPAGPGGTPTLSAAQQRELNKLNEAQYEMNRLEEEDPAEYQRRLKLNPQGPQ
jgi:hypothetical protein